MKIWMLLVKQLKDETNGGWSTTLKTDINFL